MATIKFYLKSPDKNQMCLIMMEYQDKGKKIRKSTQVKTKSHLWDGKRIKGNSFDAITGNKKIIECESRINETLFALSQKVKKASFSLVKEEIKNEEKLKKELNADFLSLFDTFIEKSKLIKQANTIKTYRTTLKTLLDFCRKEKIELCFENINKPFFQDFLNYLINDLHLLNNSVGKYIKVLKVFLNWVMNNELHSFRMNLKGIIAYNEDADIIALTEFELFTLYNCKTLNKEKERIRDLFCFQCFTGLRFSDVERLKDENIKGDFILFKTQKTRDSLAIPLNGFAKEILEKYKGQIEGRPLPFCLSNQKTNFYLKEIAEQAGILEPVMVEKFSGSKRITITKPKNEFVCTHTARRTFITLSHERGMQVEMILKITGIKKWETLKKYLKVSEKSKLLKMNEIWNKDKTPYNSA